MATTTNIADELLASLIEGAAILRGGVAPSRFHPAPPRPGHQGAAELPMPHPAAVETMMDVRTAFFLTATETAPGIYTVDCPGAAYRATEVKAPDEREAVLRCLPAAALNFVDEQERHLQARLAKLSH